MSKHIFEQDIEGQRCEVQIGWDKPTQQYYGMILGWVNDPLSREDGYYDDLIWSTMCHYPMAQSPLLEDIEQDITQRGFNILDGLIDNVREGRRRNAVNEMTCYKPQNPHVALASPNTPLHPSL